MFELNNFSAIKIGLAGSEKIRAWSRGEVKKPETINYRTQKPEMEGLFCQRIFGPYKDWECHCGKYKRIRHKGVVCDKCGVEVTKNHVRRERMGHIELATPVSHIWYFRGVPSKIGLVLDLTVKSLEQVLYYVNYIVIDPRNTDLEYKQILSDREYRDAQEKFGFDAFRAGMGAEAIREVLAKIDVEKELAQLKREVVEFKGQKRLKAISRLEIFEMFNKSKNRPEWMILEALPVIPPELRPIVQLEGGKMATSDLNDLYRRVINRNNRLKKLLELGAPDIIIRNEKRMLQEAVDSLIDNGKRGRAVTSSRHELKSLTAILHGKQGRFRGNLLGKRVDYSGRSVIVAGPSLKMYQCGLSKNMALELFKPFVLRRLVELNVSSNIKSARRLVEKARPIVWDVLEEVIKDHPVLLNRQPTLHRLGFMAFEPVLIDGNAIRLHPLVCVGFNADFDGDQMAVHVPLSVEAQAEARFLMLSTNNLLKPGDGKPTVAPTQDMVMGAYYLTVYREKAKGEGMVFKDEEEIILAYEQKVLDLQAKVKVRRTAEFKGKTISGLVETSVGRVLFNRTIPQSIGFVDRTKEENVLKYEIDFVADKGKLSDIVYKAFFNVDNASMVRMLDDIKAIGFKYATLASNSISIFDMEIPEARQAIIDEADEKVAENDKKFRRGLITLAEKKRINQTIWDETTVRITKEIEKKWDNFNPIKIMAISKARANMDQLKQLAGMRGQIVTASGDKIDVPIKSNYRLGLSNLEYFMSGRGARKGLIDTALRTATAGYLTRRLVDISQDVVIYEDDCFKNLGERVRGQVIKAITKDGSVLENLPARINGRIAINDVKHPATGEVIVKAGEMITNSKTDIIATSGLTEVEIRTVLTCRSKRGVCAKCYGRNMAQAGLVPIGEAVGIIAAQSIGENGTQLTMRTFHTGGIATTSDITQGLPRVEELFEARKPKGVAVISEVAGRVTIRKADKRDEVIVTTADGAIGYLIPFGIKLLVKPGDVVEPGTPLTEGNLNPAEVLKTRGIGAVQNYLLEEIVSAYAQQAISINDKHVELVIRQMLRKVKIENSGSTDLLPGEFVDIFTYEAANQEALLRGKEPATARRVLLGITKASLNAESFLSAASFQQTASVLTSAAIKGKVDRLTGLKENIIIGKQIPAGTGFKAYRDIKVIRHEHLTEYEELEAEQKLENIDE
ncbi:MAG: DNA-directed RNA polymerase subunit beta' [Firmicutes bacterium]|nr:DNA-directed RNA polymerase subunit beta' [Bacillota bacterium]MCL2770855.1 DNA-directed RNA polymerase subunit beta' [Bacillota bacterium]